VSRGLLTDAKHRNGGRGKHENHGIVAGRTGSRGRGDPEDAGVGAGRKERLEATREVHAAREPGDYRGDNPGMAGHGGEHGRAGYQSARRVEIQAATVENAKGFAGAVRGEPEEGAGSFAEDHGRSPDEHEVADVEWREGDERAAEICGRAGRRVESHGASSRAVDGVSAIE